MNLDITKPGQNEPIFCQSLGPSFYCSPAVLGSCCRPVQTSEKTRASSEKACKRKKTAGRGEPVSVFTNTSVRLLADKPLLMSEWQMWNVKVCSAGGFYTLAYSACAKPRRDGNKDVISKVNLRSSSLYRDYSYPLTLSNEGELSWGWIPRDHIEAQEEK